MWISVNDRLPEPGKHVLILLNDFNAVGLDAYTYCVIAQIKIGITDIDRKKMKRGELEDPPVYVVEIKHDASDIVYIEKNCYHNRSSIHYFYDEPDVKTNKRTYSYGWLGSYYCGGKHIPAYKVSHWMPIPSNKEFELSYENWKNNY